MKDPIEHSVKAHIAYLVEKGLARAPVSPLPEDFWERPRPEDPQGRALAALLDEREGVRPRV